MKLKEILLPAFVIFFIAASVHGQHPAGNYICINEIKTVGEKGFLDEFVELFNLSDSLFSMAGYALLYFDRYGEALPESLVVQPDGRSYRVLYQFPDTVSLRPFHYFLLAGAKYGDAVASDVRMKDDIFSSGQIILANISTLDTLDAVAWGTIDSLLTNEGLPAIYLRPHSGPPVSPGPFLQPDSSWSLQRNPEGQDTNDNRSDFGMRKYATPMNSQNSLKLVVDSSIHARYLVSGELSIEWATYALTQNLNFSLLSQSEDHAEWSSYPISGTLAPENREDGYYFKAQISPASDREIKWVKLQERDCFQTERFSRAVAVQSAAAAPSQELVLLEFRLGTNYPNPFNPGTTIPYSILAEHRITLTIMDLRGRHIKGLFSGIRSAGEYITAWDGADESGNRVPGGLYFCILNVDQIGSQARKILLLK